MGSSSGGWFTGGIVGVAYGTSISDCYSGASVKSGTWFQGGLVGCAYGTGGVSTSITNSYSTGLINDGSAAGNVGGMAGKDYDLTVVGSFWDTDTSGQANSAGGAGKTTSEMQAASLYTAAGWSTGIWNLADGSYPTLKPPAAPNNAPTGLALSNAGVAENEAVGTVVGAFLTTDADMAIRLPVSNVSPFRSVQLTPSQQ